MNNAVSMNFILLDGEFIGIEYEDFITLQPEHIKEAIKDLVPRIKFENLFKSFLANNGSESEGPLFTITNSDYPSCLDPIIEEESMLLTARPDVSCDAPEIFSIINSTTAGEIKTVQVERLLYSQFSQI